MLHLYYSVLLYLLLHLLSFYFLSTSHYNYSFHLSKALVLYYIGVHFICFIVVYFTVIFLASICILVVGFVLLLLGTLYLTSYCKTKCFSDFFPGFYACWSSLPTHPGNSLTLYKVFWQNNIYFHNFIDIQMAVWGMGSWRRVCMTFYKPNRTIVLSNNKLAFFSVYNCVRYIINQTNLFFALEYKIYIGTYRKRPHLNKRSLEKYNK